MTGPSTEEPRSSVYIPRQYSGEAKLEFSQRLGDKWQDLCDLIGIEPHDRVSFPQGDEARRIWEWLERRGRLHTLPDALRRVNRDDLARSIEDRAVVSGLVPASGPHTESSGTSANYRHQTAYHSVLRTSAIRRRRYALVAVGGMLGLLAVTGFVLLVIAVNGDPGGSDVGGGVPNDADARPVYEIGSQTLRVSSSPCGGHEDKFDLDTNERGHGDQPQIPLCTNAGRRADLILDPERLHTPDDDPLLVQVDGGVAASHEYCSETIRQNLTVLTGSIPLSQLDEGDYLCVKTDEGKIALVQILDKTTTSPATLIFSATVWAG